MGNIKAAVVVSCVLGMAGCASGPVAKGSMIGAASGAALGATTGVLISSPSLLGSPTSEISGDLSLDKGPTIAASTLIGVVFGAVVGAMIGHGYDEGSEVQPTAAGGQDGQSAQNATLAPTAF
jgi:hypothetical protein